MFPHPVHRGDPDEKQDECRVQVHIDTCEPSQLPGPLHKAPLFRRGIVTASELQFVCQTGLETRKETVTRRDLFEIALRGFLHRAGSSGHDVRRRCDEVR